MRRQHHLLRQHNVLSSHDSLHWLPFRDILGLAEWSGEEKSPVESTGRGNNDHDYHEDGDDDEEEITGGAVAEEHKLCALVLCFHSLFLGSQ